MTALALTVNDRAIDTTVEPRSSLADFLRDGLDLTGTHLGCEHGACGACTVLLDAVPALACITYAAACNGARVTTIEALDSDEITRELRAAFKREHALQCGYCTPGMLISARDLVLRLPAPDEHLIRVGLSGNLCRCTGYVGIVRAVRSVITERRVRGVVAEPDASRKVLGPAGSRRGAGYGVAARLPIVKAPPGQAETPGATAEIGAIPDFAPSAVLERHFDIPYPPARVFALFGDIPAMAACLPGVSLTGAPMPERVEGAMRVKLGPIAAAFHGAARIERDLATQSGCITGLGGDPQSRSSTQGKISYRLVPIAQGAATRVELTVGYRLKGMLAQVGRAALVSNLAARLIAEFARNLEQGLSAVAEESAETAELNGVSFFFGLLRERAAPLLRRRRRGGT
jgi:aerobic carbon-monoxide dehydrogenase small subunit